MGFRLSNPRGPAKKKSAYVDFLSGPTRIRSRINFLSPQKIFLDPDSLPNTAVLGPTLRYGAFRLSNPRGPAKNQLSLIFFAGPRGFEPRTAVLETDVLPLKL